MRRNAWRCIAWAASLLSAPAVAATETIPLPPRASPESISALPDGTLYVGSTYGGVMRVRGGKPASFIAPGAFGSNAVFGVLADPGHGMLWLCSNDFPATGIRVAKADAGSWVKGFDLATGTGRVSAKLPGEKSFCNDMAVAPDGALYVTNTGAPEILRLTPGGNMLELWLSDPALAGGLDGIAFGGDGNLYVNAFRSAELFRIAVTNGRPGPITKLALSAKLDLPDALRPLGGTNFIMVEGGGRIDRVTITGDRAAISPLVSGVSGATGVAIAGSTIWYVNGQLGYFFDPAKRGQTPPDPFRIVPLPIVQATEGPRP